MARFGSVEDLKAELDMLVGKRPPLVKEIGRGPGQREDRYAHLLSGDVEPSAAPHAGVPVPASSSVSDLEERVRALEEQLAALTARLDALGG
jgi:uncharacterized protein YceH (UPF0502 family)